MESHHGSQKGMLVMAFSRCNLINLFILKTNSTITRSKFLIIAKKNLVIIMKKILVSGKLGVFAKAVGCLDFILATNHMLDIN